MSAVAGSRPPPPRELVGSFTHEAALHPPQEDREALWVGCRAQ